MNKRSSAKQLLKELWEAAYPPGSPLAFQEVWDEIRAATTRAELDAVVERVLPQVRDRSNRESLSEAAAMRRFSLPETQEGSH